MGGSSQFFYFMQRVLPSLEAKIMDKSLIFSEKQVSKKAHVSEVKFRRVLKCFCEDIPATSTANSSAINRNTVQRIFTLLRDWIVDMAIEESKPFVGDIEVDESYFGPRRVRGKRGRGAFSKIPVLGLHKRQGGVFLSVVKTVPRQSIYQFFKAESWRAVMFTLMAGRLTMDW